MRLNCPWCGPRDLSEFTFQGDASRPRPSDDEVDPAVWADHVYARRNPRGPSTEFWLHSGGCRAHLKVSRDTATHAIHSVERTS